MANTNNVALAKGDALMREAITAARVPGGLTDRDTGAVEVYMICSSCGQSIIKTIITPKMAVCPDDYCYLCR